MISLPFKSNRFLSFLSSMAAEKYGMYRPAYDSPAKKIRWFSIPKIFSKFCKNPRKSSARSCSPRAVISPTEKPEPTGLSIHLDSVHFGESMNGSHSEVATNSMFVCFDQAYGFLAGLHIPGCQRIGPFCACE